MRNAIPWWIRIPVLFFLILGIMEFFVDSGDQPAIIAYPMAQAFALLVLVILISTELVVNAVENTMFHTLSEEAKARYLEEKSAKAQWEWWTKLRKRLTKEKPIAEEGDILMDHNYDGIRELDNDLPPWWTWLFYITIVFAVVYVFRYDVFGGDSQIDEYNKEVAAAEKAIAEYKRNAKDLIDVNTVEVLTESSDINAGEQIYLTNCVACHMADGGGGIGPNLADEYWILGGGIKNIFHTISEGGRSGKGMVAWKQSLKPLEIAQVASYVMTLEGTQPANPKEPQGEVWKGEE